jgi:hypothetical protein
MLLAVHTASDSTGAQASHTLYLSTGVGSKMKWVLITNLNVKGTSGAKSEAFYIHVCVRSALRTHS